MKRLMIVFALLAGCAQTQTPHIAPTTVVDRPPVVPIIVDQQAQQMTRNEVILASQECEGNGMRPALVTSKRMISGMLSDIIIDVQCVPKFKYYGN
jgi:hypothetical protein